MRDLLAFIDSVIEARGTDALTAAVEEEPVGPRTDRFALLAAFGHGVALRHEGDCAVDPTPGQRHHSLVFVRVLRREREREGISNMMPPRRASISTPETPLRRTLKRCN